MDNSSSNLVEEVEEERPLQVSIGQQVDNNSQGSRTSVSKRESQRLLEEPFYCCCGKLNRMSNSARLVMACFLAELVGTFILVVS